ncbi:MAG: alpha/beta hydrolase [Thalassobaculum sp.]|uniref:alpha/beta hydrolase n=1 Tax=Thalassobaculum sp. TaxID=2022740 RepID=UPI0032EEA58C
MATEPDIWVDPDMQRALARMAEIAREYDLPADRSGLTPDQARQRMEMDRAWWNQERPPLARIREVTVAGPDREIPVRLLYPSDDPALPVIVYLHGGGWVVGSLETHARGMHCLANASNCVVAAVDYALAPEHKFPAALDEAVAVVQHIVANGAGWGVDPRRIALAGDSAGANIALGTELELQRRGRSPVGALGLIYPVTDNDFETDSYRAFGGGEWGLSRAEMQAFFAHYVRGPEDYRDPRVVPMRGDLTGLPPTFVSAAGLDVLRDDAIRLDARLRDAGIPCSLTVYEGVVHGFMTLTRMLPKAQAMIDDLAAKLSATLRGMPS